MTERATKSKQSGRSLNPLRVLAGFGSIADELPTIDAAMTLAQALEAEIEGCFIEDADLLNLSALPFAKAIRPADRSVQHIERHQMEREFARAASNWQRTLFAKSSRTSVHCSFKIMRGAYTTELAREAAASDLVVVNPANLPHRRPNAISLLWQAIEAAMGTVIMPERGCWHAEGPVVVLAAGSAFERSMLTIAGRISGATVGKSVLLTTDVKAGSSIDVSDLAGSQLGSRDDVRVVQAGNLETAAMRLSELRPSFVILQPSKATLSEVAISMLLNSGQAPLMLLRHG